jgi:MarR family transcriptional regulator, organic hydroperoxide resistance regulator
MRPTPPGDAAAGLSDVLQFMRLLWAVDHGLQAASKRMQRQLGVTGPQRLVVRVVGHIPGVSAGEVASVLHLHPSTLTGVLRRLERDRLLVRRPDPGDRRRAVLHLTDRGRRVDRLQVGTVEAAVRAALRGLGWDHQAAARAVLGRIAAALDGVAAAPLSTSTGGPARTPGRRDTRKPRTPRSGGRVR